MDGILQLVEVAYGERFAIDGFCMGHDGHLFPKGRVWGVAARKGCQQRKGYDMNNRYCFHDSFHKYLHAEEFRFCKCSAKLWNYHKNDVDKTYGGEFVTVCISVCSKILIWTFSKMHLYRTLS